MNPGFLFFIIQTPIVIIIGAWTVWHVAHTNKKEREFRESLWK